MTNDGIELTRRKILASAGAVGVAGAGAALGTSAYFTDEESFENNELVAGELDLKIDWQQRYWGPENAEDPVYGSAGRPWVNAHPDHDGNGIQSLDSDEYDSVSDDGVVTYEDLGANIQEYLTCETLTHDYEFGDRDALVELDDVKPGDRGEITFSYHLCDNPGWVWLCGELIDAAENGTTEPEAASENEEDGVVELLDAINVQVWYDINCDNEFDEDGEEREVLAGSPTTLRSFLNAFDDTSENCMLLNAAAYPGVEGETECFGLDPIDFSSDEVTVDGAGQVVRVDEGTSGDDSDNLEVWIVLEDPDNGAFDQVVVLLDDLHTQSGRANDVSDLASLTQFDWTVVDDVVGDDDETYESDDVGMCTLVLTDDEGSTTADLIGASCSTGENNVVVPIGGNELTSVQFSYCGPSDEPVCFPESWTFCLGFEWWVPDHVGNEIQSDSVSFDLGFYTEQCRHNGDPGQTMSDD